MLPKHQILIASIAFGSMLLTLSSCQDNEEDVVIVSHEKVEVMTETELYKLDNDSISNDSLRSKKSNMMFANEVAN